MSASEINAIVKRIKELDIQEVHRRQERSRLVARLELATKNKRDTKSFFAPGDKIKVRNAVKRPSTAGSQWTKDKERRGEVESYETESDKVWYITENGTRTWRLAKNVKKI